MHEPQLKQPSRRHILQMGIAAFAAGAMGLTCGARAAGLTQEVWLQKLSMLRGFPGSFQFSLNINSFKYGEETGGNALDVRFRSYRQVLVIFRAPQNVVGRRILVDGDDMWLVTPGSNRILRVSPSQRLLGEASNGDAINTNFQDYTLRHEEETSLDGVKAVKLTLLAKSPQQSYQGIEYFIDPVSKRPRSSLHYTASGKLIKEIIYEQYKSVAGQDMINKMKIINPLINNQFTLMTVDHYQAKTFADGLFKKDNLLDVML